MPTAAPPRVEKAAPPRAEKHIVTADQVGKKKAKQRRKRRAAVRSTPSKAVPVGNTRAQKKQAAIRAAAKARSAAKNTRESTTSKTAKSRLMRPTVSSRSKGKALAVESKSARKKMTTRQRMDRLENEVHEAMAVMDAETGKLLNYKQLMRNPKYKKKWGISSANEFGHMANGVGGQTKNPTNTIKFIRKDEVPKDRRKDVTYGSFVCNMRPEKKEKKEPDL